MGLVRIPTRAGGAREQKRAEEGNLEFTCFVSSSYSLMSDLMSDASLIFFVFVDIVRSGDRISHST